MDHPLLPLFLNLERRRAVLVGGGRVAAAKLQQLVAARADVFVVAPAMAEEIVRSRVRIACRPFEPADLDGAWLVVAAATSEVNQAVAHAAAERRVFVNAVDDPANATAFLSGVVRRDGVTLAISTDGVAPGLTALIREALDRVLPDDLAAWVEEARVRREQWKAQGIAMERRRPLLLEALNRIYARPTSLKDDGAELPLRRDERGRRSACRCAGAADEGAGGRVSLVGAGPGDPALLTRKAMARLRAADLVLYDALVDERVLALARRAQRFFVGKRAGRHAITQEGINTLMIRAVRRGRHVVRLKGGDPFVFGRGGEEVAALGAAGIAVEVVPGISSALAAPALAGIPLTYRGVSSAFVVVSGHDEAVFDAAIGGLKPGSVTIVVLMAVGQAADVGRRLLAGGWAGTTPAALVMDASLPRQQAWRGTLSDLAGGHVTVPTNGAGTIVIGEVVMLASDAPRMGSGRVGAESAGNSGPRERVSHVHRR